MGDGQRFSLRAQASQFFQTYSISLTDPWFGGKKPVQLSVSLSHTIQFQFNNLATSARDRVNRDSRNIITGGSIGLAKRLNWPDRQFTLSHAISYQNFKRLPISITILKTIIQDYLHLVMVLL